jgi:hypothetical protein
MLSPRILQPPKEAFEPGPQNEAARKEFGDRYTEMMRREWFSIGIHLGYMYEGSPIIVSDGTAPPEDTVSSYTQTARPGSRAPHVWLSEGRSTLDLFGREFVLLRFGSRPPSGEPMVDAAKKRGVPLKVVDIVHPEAEKAYERRLVLVRPDGSVAWRADEHPRDSLAIIDAVRGAASLSVRIALDAAATQFN